VAGAGGGAEGALVTFSGSQVTVSTSAIVPFAAEIYDDGGSHDNIINNTRLEVPAGVTRVRLTARVFWTVNLTSNTILLARIRKNGGFGHDGEGRDSMAFSAGNYGNLYQNVETAVILVTPGDYFELGLEVSGTGTITYASGTWFTMEYK